MHTATALITDLDVRCY